MMKHAAALFLLLLSCSIAKAQQVFRIMEYNVENLFDVQHDEGKLDREFLPDGAKRWNSYKYWKKLNALSKVIAAVGEQQIPDMIVLCEVENDTVLRDLCRRSALRALGYEYVVTASDDERGIDVAVLYQRGRFRKLSCDTVVIPGGRYGFSPTRDILYLKGQMVYGDTLHLIACHLPSKYSGTRAADRHRILASEILAALCDSIIQNSPRSVLVVTGDFNASKHEDVFVNHLLRIPGLYALQARPSLHKQSVRGTYRYRGSWSELDHFLVSLPEIRGCRVSLKDSCCWIADYPFLLQTDTRYGGLKPFRTYLGPRYLGGYSDHLPLFLDLIIRDDKVHYSESSWPGKSAR